MDDQKQKLELVKSRKSRQERICESRLTQKENENQSSTLKIKQKYTKTLEKAMKNFTKP